MKKMNKKGFTIVELVIVIAVIAILSAVMIPTFSGVISKSKKSAATQEANKAYQAVIAALDYANDETLDVDSTEVDAWIKAGDYYVSVTNGVLGEPTKTEPEVEWTAMPEENAEVGTKYYVKAATYFDFDETDDPEAYAAEVYVYDGTGAAADEGEGEGA